jgi:glycosyltransferase involved in cell wall biosynthesis
LQRLYAESAIYWHATGLGEDETRAPDKSEHFGITTVEAMAAGCASIVIAKGGQPEIIQHERNGVLWRTLEELERWTLCLIRDESLRASLAARAVTDSRKYDKRHFCARLDELIANS